MKLKDSVKLWDHQTKAREAAKHLDFYALFFEMGTGKTLTALSILNDVFEQISPEPKVLIVTPPVVRSNWVREIQQYCEIHKNFVVDLEGTVVQRMKLFDAGIQRGAYIFIANYETLLMDRMFDRYMKHIEVVVFDESHKLKNYQAKRTKSALKLAHKCKKRYLLTGSPILNAPTDLFTQFLAMDLGASFGKNYFEFRAKYMIDKNANMPAQKYFPMWVPNPTRLSELTEKISKVGAVIKKDQCLTLPPLVKVKRFVPLSGKQMQAYEFMKKNLIAIVDDNTVVADLAITKALRLQQIVSGFFLNDEEVIYEFQENPRADALKELLEELTPLHKVIVWAVFHQNYETIRRVCKGLGIDWAEVHGEVKDKHTQIEKFKTDPKCRVFLGHPGSGGIGINLVNASYSIWYSRGFSLEQELQAESRNHRGGSEIHEKVTRIDLVAPNTIDEAVVRALAAKQTISNKVIREMIHE